MNIDQKLKAEFVDIPLIPKNIIDRLLIRCKIKKKVARYALRPMLVGTRVRIAQRARSIPEINLGNNNTDAFMKASVSTKNDLGYIAAVAIQNNRNKPSKILLDRLRHIDDDLFFQILEKSMSTMQVESFMKSIALIKGTEFILKKESN